NSCASIPLRDSKGCSRVQGAMVLRNDDLQAAAMPHCQSHPDESSTIGTIPIEIADALKKLGIPNTALWHQIVDSLFTFLAVMSTDGTVLDVNRAALRCSDLRLADVVGQPLWQSY